MKPSWDDAPEWANWFAWDLNGSLFSEEDLNFHGTWWTVGDEGRIQIVENYFDEDRGCGKEKRP